MFIEALRVSLRILFFRAGPDDFPFDATPRLTRECAGLAVAVFALWWAVVMPAIPALLAAAVTVAAMWAVTRVVLNMRKLENRVPQTLNALLLVNALLTLAMLPAFAALAPPMLELLDKLQADADLANHPEKWPPMPTGASLWLDILAIWQLIACARVYGRAANTSGFGGLLLTLLSMLAMGMFVAAASPLMALFGR